MRHGELMTVDDSKIDRYAVVGHPVKHSRSPMIQQFFAQETGENMSYGLLDASPDDFEVVVRGFGASGGKGLNITVPHKQAAFELATELGQAAVCSGAVNTLTFRTDGTIRGDNTDGIGFMKENQNILLLNDFKLFLLVKREYTMSQKGIRVQNYYTLNLDQMESLKLFLFIFMLHRKLG